MGRYRVYRSGESQPVRVAALSPRERAAAGRPAPLAVTADAPETVSHGRLWWLLAAVAAAAGAALFWLYGREPVANTLAAVDIAKLSGKVPEWSLWLAPAIAVLVAVLVALYLAFGRLAVLKAVLVAVLVAVLAAPGMAVGWANGTVGAVSDKAPEIVQVVEETKEQLRPELPGKPMNILLIGSDKSGPGDPGRSDTQLLVRLDPSTKSISMLSLPRDLLVDIPGVGRDKMNTAYSYGGPALAVETFGALTGLPINHYVEVNFDGFWHVVSILGGVYLPIDHRYFVPASASYKSINLEAGYQLVQAKQALNFVRFRHDQKGDFTRMQRQQLFLRELQRQSGRWSEDWTRVVRLIKAITAQTTSDIDSLRRLQPLVELVFEVDTANISQVHLEGSTPMIDGVSYVEATPEQIAAAVQEFTDPTRAPVRTKEARITKTMFPVRVFNGTQTPGLATSAGDQLAAQGYDVVSVDDAPEFTGLTSVIYAPRTLKAHAQDLAAMITPSAVQLYDRTPGALEGVTVVLGPDFGGYVVTPTPAATATPQPQQTIEEGVRYDEADWQALDAQTPIALRMPTVWSSGLGYDEFREYSIRTPEGGNKAAAVVVGTTPQGGFWNIQAMRWLDPPAIEHPTRQRRVAGTRYLLFYQGDRLHMVAWKKSNTLYWVLNTLDNQLSDEFMMGLATSFKPVK